MATTGLEDRARNWWDIASAFLRLGATSYGGPAIMGIMQTELQERRRWVSKERFVEGLSLVNMLPGATVVQLGIFVAYARGGWWGGLLGGLCFVLPAFFVMLALTVTYAMVGVAPIMRGALDGLGPVVLGIFVVAVYRLGKATASTRPQILIAVAAAAVSIASPLGIAAILLLAGGVGIFLFQGKKLGAVVVASMAVLLIVMPLAWWSTSAPVPAVARGVLMVAAYVGYRVAGVAGAAVAAGAVFLPSFILMLAVLPVLDRVRRWAWARAMMKGMGPAVIGVVAVSLFRLAPHALPDPLAIALLVATVTALLAWRVGTVKLMVAGSVLGVLRSRLFPLPGVKAARDLTLWVRG